jgi:glycosyltransferase involved in cell wall biosynthesis
VDVSASAPRTPVNSQVAILTGCQDRPYAFGLSMALAAEDLQLDVIGSNEVDSPEMHGTPQINFLNLRESLGPGASAAQKAKRSLFYYWRLLRYAAAAKPKIFHILWNNKIEYFDRTLLLLYYKALGKKIVFTAHNVNQARRDAKDSPLNRLTLRIQYRLTDHIFVHTQKMKRELLEDFGVREDAVTVIPFGINNSLPHTGLTPAQAKEKLGLSNQEKVILFMGRIKAYKGLEHLLTAFQSLVSRRPEYRLIIAGEQKKGSEKYLDDVLARIERDCQPEQVILKIQFIPDDEMELYLKAADVLALPYKEIFQSGVLFLGYSFGLPVVATDVGSFREEIVEGRTGFLCRPADPEDLAKTIASYFETDLYRDLARRRRDIEEYANDRYSWDAVGDLTRNVYANLLGRQG